VPNLVATTALRVSFTIVPTGAVTTVVRSTFFRGRYNISPPILCDP
jgi:hypothetical protein